MDVSTSKELSWSRAAMAAKVPATGGTLAVVSLLLAILTVFTVVVNGQIVFPEDERGVRECGVGEVCVAKDSCLEYKKKLQQRRDATAQDNPEERAKMVEQLRAMVCHKTEKKVCCPVTKGKNGELLLESEREQQKLTFLAKTRATHTIGKCLRWLSWIVRGRRASERKAWFINSKAAVEADFFCKKSFELELKREPITF